MKRIGTTILLALAMSAQAATAGDGAAVNVLGFSPDGSYFAFEQYGEQDGPGALYSTITAVEVSTDRMVKGSPIAAVMDPDDPRLGKEPRDKQLAEIRAKAATDAAALLKQLGVTPATFLIASVREARPRVMLDSEQVKKVRQATVATVALPATFGRQARLVLREFDIALPRCKDLVTGDHPTGLGLTLERKGRPTVHLRRDQTIPASRGCPDHYGIAEVHGVPLPDGSIALAVVIQYFYMSVEGPDRRFTAVTGRIPRL